MTAVDPAIADRIANLEARLEVARAEVEQRGARITELEQALADAADRALAEIHAVCERANQETAVHRHEAQRAVAEAGDTRRAASELEARVRQLEAEAAAQAAQTARLAGDAARAERERDGYRQIAHGWQGVALARAEERTPQRTGRRP